MRINFSHFIDFKSVIFSLQFNSGEYAVLEKIKQVETSDRDEKKQMEIFFILSRRFRRKSRQ